MAVAGTVATGGAKEMPPKPPRRLVASGAGRPGRPPVRSPEKSIERPANGFAAPLPLEPLEAGSPAGFEPFVAGVAPRPVGVEAPRSRVSSVIAPILPRSNTPGEYPSEVPQLREDVPAEELELARVVDVVHAHEDVVDPGVVELAERLDELGRGGRAPAARDAHIGVCERGDLDLRKRPPERVAVTA